MDLWSLLDRQPTERNFIMNNARNILAISAVALFGMTAAYAQEATPDTWTKINTSASVQDVRADAVAAQKAGNISYGEATRHGVKAAQLTPVSRAQVQAEAREAVRLGLVQFGEGPARIATAQETEAVKLAGLRASGDLVAQASK
jgi:hypothetical protein